MIGDLQDPLAEEPQKTDSVADQYRSVVSNFLLGMSGKALQTGTDPESVVDSMFKPTKRTIAADILGGFLAGMGGRQYKTVREQLVEREIEKQKLAFAQEQQNISKLQAMSQAANTLRQMQPTPRENKFLEDLQTAKEYISRLDAPEERKAELLKSFEDKQFGVPGERSFNMDEWVLEQLTTEERKQFAMSKFLAAKRAARGDSVLDKWEAKHFAVTGREWTEKELQDAVKMEAQLKHIESKKDDPSFQSILARHQSLPLGPVAKQALEMMMGRMKSDGEAEREGITLAGIVERGNKNELRLHLEGKSDDFTDAQETARMTARGQNINAAIRLKEIINANPDAVGRIPAILQYIEQGIKGVPYNEKTFEIDMEMRRLLYVFRQGLSGAQFGEKESSEYAKVNPNVFNNARSSIIQLDKIIEIASEERGFTLSRIYGPSVVEQLWGYNAQ